VRRSQVVELPELRPVVIEAWTYAARCAACGDRTVGETPAGLEATRTHSLRSGQAGPRVEALLGSLHYGHHLSHERLVAVCESVFGLRISEGAIGVRVDGRNWWHWVFQTPTASCHVIAPSRGSGVVTGFLGDARPEVWGSNAFPTQFAAPAARHQLCLSHQIRDPVGIPPSGGDVGNADIRALQGPWWAMTYAVEVDGPAGAEWARELRHGFSRTLRLYRERGRVTPVTFANLRLPPPPRQAVRLPAPRSLP
jgi:hypothetical protein